MINLKDDKFTACSKVSVFIFRYIIPEDKNNIKIELIKRYNSIYIIKEIFLIEKGKNEIIALNNNFYLK